MAARSRQAQNQDEESAPRCGAGLVGREEPTQPAPGRPRAGKENHGLPGPPPPPPPPRSPVGADGGRTGQRYSRVRSFHARWRSPGPGLRAREGARGPRAAPAAGPGSPTPPASASTLPRPPAERSQVPPCRDVRRRPSPEIRATLVPPAGRGTG